MGKADNDDDDDDDDEEATAYDAAADAAASTATSTVTATANIATATATTTTTTSPLRHPLSYIRRTPSEALPGSWDACPTCAKSCNSEALQAPLLQTKLALRSPERERE